jgi:hypothetical protein
MRDLSGVIRIVVAPAQHVDGVFEAANRQPAEVEGVVHTSGDENGDNQRESRTEVGEKDKGENFDGRSEEPIEVREMFLNPAVFLSKRRRSQRCYQDQGTSYKTHEQTSLRREGRWNGKV